MKTEKRKISINGEQRTLKNGRADISNFWNEVMISGKLDQMYQASDLADPHFFGISIMKPEEFIYIIGVESNRDFSTLTHFDLGEVEYFEFSGEGNLPSAIQNMQESIWQEHGQEIAAESVQRDVSVNVEEYFEMTESSSRFNILIPKSKIEIG
jgi:hypothetical protein